MKKIGFLTCIFCMAIGMATAQSGQDLSRYVDPFIGTEGGGNTFPGASLPYGMVKLGPDCGNKQTNSGYIPGGAINGFSHIHVSGSGGGPKYGNILVMPFNGEVMPGEIQSAPENVQASPGYFSVLLDENNIQAELTSSRRVGFHRYTFSDNVDKNILVDAGSFLARGHRFGEAQELVGSEVRIESPTRISGYSRVRGGWNMGGAYTVYFSALFDTPAESYGVWRNGKIQAGATLMPDKGDKTGAWFRFADATDNTVHVKVGISFISAAKAAENMEGEIPHWDFDETRQEAVVTWNSLLGRITLEGASPEMKTVFYTAFYHATLMPVDRTGENPLWTSPEPYYDDFYCIWDTYRATNPLLTLVQPEREKEIVRALIDIYDHEQYMPDARAGNFTGRTQGGSNCDMVVADAFLKGLEGIDYEKAYEAMVKNAEIPPGGNQHKQGRGGISKYIERGYVSFEYIPESTLPDLHIPKLYDRAGSRTVEYAANDWAIAQVARGLGLMEDYRKYKKRASNWANLWNGNITHQGATGFIWPKTASGRWLDGFSVTRGGSWGNFFYEADSWEYSFYVPHDVSTLMDSCGGREAFIARLDTFFTNGHFQVSNEPSFFTPCLYNYAGRQDKSNQTIRNIIQTHYHTGPDGIPGNDDAGSMSAWVLFNMMGFFPNAGQDVYVITAPHYPAVSLELGENKTLEVLARDLSDQNLFIQKVELNGKPLNRSWFRHEEISEGGKLEFFMGNQPNNSWEQTLPPSLKDYQ